MRLALLCLCWLTMIGNGAADTAPPHWVVAWAASAQGPYPVGNPSAPPDLRLAFPDDARGARNQGFRLILKPTLWGPRARVRFSNVMGNRPLLVQGVYVGLQTGAAALAAGSNQPITFGGARQATVEPGQSLWSDAVALPFAAHSDPALLAGRKLAVSFHVQGESGPMTWHAKALQTSYVGYPDRASAGADEGEAAFPFPTTSWFFVDALDMEAPADAFAVVCFGDSITDGTMSTLNGDDRWPDVLARRLQAHQGNRIAVVNAGIGGNQIAGPATYSVRSPFPGGPSAGDRLERDVLSLSGVGAVIWLEGINDFSKNGNASVATVLQAMGEIVTRLRRHRPALRVIGATLPPALGSTIATHGFAEQDQKRRALNDHIRSSGLFDAVIDFDGVISDPTTGAMRTAYVHNTTVGGEGDKLHPNRLGYLDMGQSIDLEVLKPVPSAQ